MMRTIAGWLSADAVPTWIWLLWMKLWFLCVKIRYTGRAVARCDSCYEPQLLLAMYLRRTAAGKVEIHCTECTRLSALMRQAAKELR